MASLKPLSECILLSIVAARGKFECSDIRTMTVRIRAYFFEDFGKCRR